MSMLLAIRRWWVGLAILAFLGIRLAYLSTGSDRQLITRIPDDAFYYLQLASSWAQTGHFSFDAISVTSGFQILFAYFLACILRLFPGLELRQLWAMTGSLGCILFALAAQSLLAALDAFDRDTRRQTIHRMAVLAAFSCPIAGMLSTNLMESVFVLPLSAATVSVLLQPPRRTYPWLAFVLAFAATLARSDFILLPAAWLAAAALFHAKEKTTPVLPSVICLMGSICAALLILLHNDVLTGHATQMSAAIKFHWSQLAGHSTVPAIFLVLRTLLPAGLAEFGGKWSLAVGVCVIAVAFSVALRNYLGRVHGAGPQVSRMPPADLVAWDRRYLPFIAACLTCAGYVILYSLNSGATQAWYGANVIVAFAILLYGLLALTRKYAGAVPFWVIVLVYLASSVAGLAWEPWPNQSQTYVAALNLGTERPAGRVGSWNAGIMRYFSKQDVVDLDGLVDDEAAGDVLENCIVCFILRHDVRYIADSEVMFQHAYAERGGYGDGRLRKCAIFLNYLDDDFVHRLNERWNGGRIALYKIDRECLVTSVDG
jgi:hypothetical protein